MRNRRGAPLLVILLFVFVWYSKSFFTRATVGYANLSPGAWKCSLTSIDHGTGRLSVRGGAVTLESGVQELYRITWRKCSRWVHRVGNLIPIYLLYFFVIICNHLVCWMMRSMLEKRDARTGNEWVWANARGRPNVITCVLCYSGCMGVGMHDTRKRERA
jgi:hypothetical protein